MKYHIRSIWLRAFLAGILLLLSSCAERRVEVHTLEFWFPSRDVQPVRFLENQKITFFFQEVPLSSVLQEMHKMTGVHFVKHESMKEDPMVMLRVKELPVFVALCWLCGSLHADWGVKDKVVYVGLDLKDMDFVCAY